MAINDIYRVTAQWQSSAGDIFQWVWNYQQLSGPDLTPEQLDAGIEAMLGLAWAEIEDTVHNSVVSDRLDIALWDSGAAQFDTVTSRTLPDLDGTASGSGPANWQNAPVVLFFTDRARSLGKKFLFGIVQGGFAGQSPTAGLLAEMLLFALEFSNNLTFNGATFQPGNFNHNTAVFSGWNGDVAANLLTGTQDRRRRGIGI